MSQSDLSFSAFDGLHKLRDVKCTQNQSAALPADSTLLVCQEDEHDESKGVCNLLGTGLTES